MGNQQSGGPQFCSRGELYTDRGEISNSKLDPESRVGYNMSTKPKFQAQRFQKAHQQMAPQQQEQEEIFEIPIAGPGKWKIPKSFMDFQYEPEEAEKHKPYNNYTSSLNTEEKPVCSSNLNKDMDSEMIDYYKDYFTLFQGVFGNVIVNKTGLVHYTDFGGKEHLDDYDRGNIEKIFPMGISFGGLTKTIWFKDTLVRNDAFDMMISDRTLMAHQTKLAAAEDDVRMPDDEENMKIFEGINDTNVIVHSDNIVLFTDINKSKHCVTYDKHNISKCFPKGICNGGLPKSIWFNDEMERDLCFMLMRWNLEDESNFKPKESPVQEFTGFCGGIVLHQDSQIEFTSFEGERLKCFYEPSEISEVFPQGISFGRLPKTIWFQDVRGREKCIEAMRKM